MNAQDCHIVIMAGGIGSRFWPMSTPDYPKQFVDVMGVGKSLLQLTVTRFLPLCSIEHIWIVTSEKYVRIVHEQLPDLPYGNILAEPESRNTAPCIGYACWKIQKKYPRANIVVTPSDAFIIDNEVFRQVVLKALNFTSANKAIVTIGIKPNRPETGYGYILSEPNHSEEDLFKVAAFKEKPDLETAKLYLQQKDYYWNSGIFVWNIETIVTEFRKFVPELANQMDKMVADFYTENETETLKQIFPQCEKISIDYAVMEKSNSIFMIPADFGWNDLGTWGALHSLLPKDEGENVVVGDLVKLYNCKNCIIHTSKGNKIVLEGLDGYIVAERNGQILICRLSEEQKIKEFSI